MSNETELVAFAEVVRKAATQIAIKCLAGKTDQAGELAHELGNLAADVKNQKQMQQEDKGGNDLATLRVDATSASNSETGWERED